MRNHLRRKKEYFKKILRELKNLIKKKIESFGKTFNLLTKETVRGFLIDSLKSMFKI